MKYLKDFSPQKLYRLRQFVYELFGEDSGYVTLAIVLAENEAEAQEKFKVLLKHNGFHDFEIVFNKPASLLIDEFQSFYIGKSMWWIGEEYY